MIMIGVCSPQFISFFVNSRPDASNVIYFLFKRKEVAMDN